MLTVRVVAHAHNQHVTQWSPTVLRPTRCRVGWVDVLRPTRSRVEWVDVIRPTRCRVGWGDGKARRHPHARDSWIVAWCAARRRRRIFPATVWHSHHPTIFRQTHDGAAVSHVQARNKSPISAAARLVPRAHRTGGVIEGHVGEASLVPRNLLRRLKRHLVIFAWHLRRLIKSMATLFN